MSNGHMATTLLTDYKKNTNTSKYSLFRKQRSNPLHWHSHSRCTCVAREISPLCCSKALVQRPNAHPCTPGGCFPWERGLRRGSRDRWGNPPSFHLLQKQGQAKSKGASEKPKVPQISPSQGAGDKLHSSQNTAPLCRTPHHGAPHAPGLYVRLHRAQISRILITTILGLVCFGVEFVWGGQLSFFLSSQGST